MKTPTVPQLQILRWLRLYPAVKIHWIGNEDDQPELMPYWCDDAARMHMGEAMSILGVETDVNVSHPTAGTPSIRMATFFRLLGSGWIEKVGQRTPANGWTPMYYYSVSQKGRDALLA